MELREYLDGFEESCFIVGGEDADKAKGVKYWTLEQFYSSYINLDKKIERVKKAREAAKRKKR